MHLEPFYRMSLTPSISTISMPKMPRAAAWKSMRAAPASEGPGLGIDIDEEKAELAARPKANCPRVGVLEPPGGSTYYTPHPPANASAASRKATSAAYAAACGTTMDQDFRPSSTRPERRGLQGIVYRSAPVGPDGAPSHQTKSINRPA